MAKSKCLKFGWIELNDFIKKYYGLTSSNSIKSKRDVIMRSIGKFEKTAIETVGSSIVVNEMAFCIFRHIAYKEDVK